VAFVFSCGIVFWRTALSDLLDIQGDRIVGRETIPILIGVKKTRRLLQTLLAILTVLPILSAMVGWTAWAGTLLTCNVLILWLFWWIYKKGQLVDRLLYEGMIDGNLVLAGIVFILYGVL
jgi:4-hydroxybenzoate polyprenyltransferase